MITISIIMCVSIVVSIFLYKTSENFSSAEALIGLNALVMITAFMIVIGISGLINTDDVSITTKDHNLNINLIGDNFYSFDIDHNIKSMIVIDLNLSENTVICKSDTTFSYAKIEMYDHDIKYNNNWLIFKSDYQELKSAKLYLSQNDLDKIFKN